MIRIKLWSGPIKKFGPPLTFSITFKLKLIIIIIQFPGTTFYDCN